MVCRIKCKIIILCHEYGQDLQFGIVKNHYTFRTMCFINYSGSRAGSTNQDIISGYYDVRHTLVNKLEEEAGTNGNQEKVTWTFLRMKACTNNSTSRKFGCC